jgi:predicted restriction endonuclease
LFIRVTPIIKNTTQPFVYCGRLKFVEYIEGTSKPVHLIFQNIDYQDDTENKDLLEVYFWKPHKIGGSSQFKITNRETVSEDRKRKLKEPNVTERSGLVTSRVGQGYYRQQIIEKWEGKCPVTQSELLKILISSHIVPWSECNDKERLDVENGILLSPDVDSLFDKHLISFSDNGQMIVSEKLSGEELNKLGIPEGVTIKVTDGMKKYLQRHRERLFQND